MTRLLSRLAALGLLCLVLSAAAFGIVLPLIDAHRSGVEQIDELETQIAAFQSRRDRVGTARPIEIADAALIVADTETLAGAVMQQRILPLLAEVEATVESRDIGKPIPHEHWTRIPLRLNLTVQEDRLPRLLFRLETQSTYLFVEELVLRRLPADSANGIANALSVRLLVSGLMRRPPT